MIHMPGFFRPGPQSASMSEWGIWSPAPPPHPPATPSETGDTAKQADTLLTRNLATLQWLAHPGFHTHGRIGVRENRKNERERERGGGYRGKRRQMKVIERKWVKKTIIQTCLHSNKLPENVYSLNSYTSLILALAGLLVGTCHLANRPCKARLPQGLKPSWLGFHLRHKACQSNQMHRGTGREKEKRWLEGND